MIYAHKPQRSGKSITANTNNPPQDPPPPKEDILLIERVIEPIPEPVKPTPEPIVEPIESIMPQRAKITIPIKKTPIPKKAKSKKPKVTKTRFAFLHKLFSKIKIFFKRSK